MPFDDDGKALDPEESLIKLKKWVDDWSDATVEARALSERDRDYYDGNQWTAEEVAVLSERNQPAVTVNLMQRKLNTILGHEVRTRVDPEALPRTPQHEDGAIAITDALRYIADREDFDGLRSDVAEDMAIEGMGGTVIVPQERNGQVEITMTHVPWDRIVYDPHSRRPDFSDAHYLGVVTWMYKDEILERYPEADEELVEMALDNRDTDGTYSGETLDDRPRFVWYDEKRGRARVVEMYYRKGSVWYVVHFLCSGQLFEPVKVNLVDEQGETLCPVLLSSCYVNRDNERYGLARAMISPQDEINKRRSKLLHLLNTRQHGVEDGAFLEPDRARAELAKPDGIVEFTPGALTDGRFQVFETGSLAAQQFQLLQESKTEIESVGPNAQAALEGNITGRVAQQRMQAATMELETFFDHLRDWEKRVFEVTWHWIRLTWDNERWFRVRDDDERKGYRFVGLNKKQTKLSRIQQLITDPNPPPIELAIQQVMPEGLPVAQQAQQQYQQLAQQAQQQGAQLPPVDMNQVILQQLAQLPSAREPFIGEHVANLDLDIILTTAPDTAVIEQEEFERLAMLAQNGVPIPPDVLIEASQIRSKRKLLKMLEEQGAPNPEAIAQEQQIAQMQMQLMQAQVQALQAQAQDNAARSQERQAHMAEMQAKAQKTAVEAQIGVPAEAQKDLAMAKRHETEAVGELQSQVNNAEDRSTDAELGGPFPLNTPGE